MIPNVVESSWPARRARFNHDWLKNKYIPDIEAYLNILDEGVRDAKIETGFFSAALPLWGRKYSDEAKALLKEYEPKMLPSRYLGERADVWVRDGVDDVWKAKAPVARVREQAETAVRRADERFHELMQATEVCQDRETAARADCRAHVAEFLTAVKNVAAAFEEFPRLRELP